MTKPGKYSLIYPKRVSSSCLLSKAVVVYFFYGQGKHTDLQLTELSINGVQEEVTVVQFERRGIQSEHTAAVIEVCEGRDMGFAVRAARAEIQPRK